MGKCTFCDISLDYIKLYMNPFLPEFGGQEWKNSSKTGENGSIFVDEAPPALMRKTALEILDEN